ncbi:MAG: gliding motility-associated C-terminal domain-containing protein, partial [Chitinophagaceae bacterium]
DVPANNNLAGAIRLEVVSGQGCRNDTTKTITILNTPVVTLQDSTLLCAGDSIRVQATSDGRFLWTSHEKMMGATTATSILFPSTSTYYYVSVTGDNQCTGKDSIWVQVDLPIGVSFKDIYKGCISDTSAVQIQVKTMQPATFTWTASPLDDSIGDDTTATIFVKPFQTTNYHFVAKSRNVCPDETGNILLQYGTVPVIKFPSRIIAQPAGTIFTLNPLVGNLNGKTQYTWSPGYNMYNRFVKNPSVVADKDITYTLNLLDEYGCTASDSVTIKVLCNGGKILMANAFTPNGDGRNDRFYVTGYGIKKVTHLAIIDRWGKKIFEKNNIAANDPSKGWDGNSNGKPAATGTYLYLAEIECAEGNRIPLQGSVVLIR